ncbi:hypothetical protein [Blastopirellula marina]|uniref:Uncharacterized protein n=1 Tax=Blastopirellula marina TaxID=124 RepID=A0A2S8GPE5_9BACT|nr:hypothetical protein [Blastopirellula marina]PQO46300.1 hypothetical protein C5Y93_09965 [Blastopirellula marina]
MEPLNPYRSPEPEHALKDHVHADIFRGTTLAWFADRYEFCVPQIAEVAPQAIAFYEASRAKIISHDPLTFWRGNLWSTILGPERFARQRIEIHIDADQSLVKIEYHINMILPTRVYYHSHREVLRLAAQLGATDGSDIRQPSPDRMVS